MKSTAAAIPAHLPERLAICYYGWDWITSALPNEPYGDLERAVRETKERGFNCIRADLGIGLIFDAAGNRRAPIEFADWIPGCSDNIHCVNCRGGGVHSVWERVIRLFELADRHDLYIIGTSWLYQDFIAHVADARIRDEILTVPYRERLRMLATQWDRLLKDLEQRGLARRMAMVELLNEMENSPVFAPVDPATPPPTAEDWLQRRYPESDLANLRGLAFEAVALLRERHPEQMVTVDIGSPDFMPTLLPDNAQVADYHVYADGLTQAIADAAGARLFDVTCVPDPAGNALLRSLLKPDPMPWKEFKRRAARVRASWHAVAWFYANVDNSKYDDWCVAHFEELRPRIAQSVEERFRAGVEFARSRDLPMVMDEGCICYPPLHSRLVELPAGRYSEELAVDIAIATGHWGMLPTGYFRPNTPVWHDASQCAWVRGLNERVLDSRPVRSDPEAPAPS